MTPDELFEAWWKTMLDAHADPNWKELCRDAFTQGVTEGATQRQAQDITIVRQIVVDELPGADTTLERILDAFRTTPHQEA